MLSNLEAAIVRNPLVAGVEATVLSAVEQMRNLSKLEIDGDNASSTCVVIVSDGQKALGILTQQDLVHLVIQQQPIAQLTLKQFLKQHRSPSNSLIISQSELRDLRDINAAIAHFESSQITHLAIVDAQDQLVGMLFYESLKRLRDSIIHQATAALLVSQQKIHERLAKAEPLKDVLVDLLQTMETYLRGSSCSITLCRDGRLGDVIAPSLPPDYARIVSEMGLPIAEGVGSCGTAAFRRELVVVTDIENDPIWQNDKAFVLCYGLQACSSIPIFASDRTLLGTFGIYFREQKAPQTQELDWIAQAANIAGIAIERDRTVQALLELNHELEDRVQVRTQELQEREQFLQTVLDTFPLSVFWKDVDSVYLGCNQNFLNDAGLQEISQIIGKTDHELIWGETEADFYRANDRAVIESQTAKLRIEETQHHADGQIIWTETNKLPLRNLQGDVIGVLGTYQDISDRKAAEKALMLKQSHLAALINNIPHIAWIKDQQSRFIAVNTPFVQACGVSAEELVGKTDFDIWSADLAQAYRDDDAEVLQSGQRKVVVEKIARADGTFGWLETTKTPFRDDQLNIGGTVGIAADITDLKMLELSLKASERRYASLAAAAPVAIFRFDEPLNCVYVNERWSALSGRPMESALGHGWMEGLHPEDSEQRIAEWTEYYAHSNPASQIIHGSEGRHLRPDGTTTWCYIQVAKEFDDDDNVVGYIGTLTDITDRKNIELALQASQAQFRRMTESVPGMIYRYVLLPDGRDELVYVSPKVQQIFELTPEAVIQDMSCLWARFHPEDIPMIQSAIQDSAASLQPFFVEGRLLLPNEQVKWIQVSSQPDRQENCDVIWDGVVIDISDRKNAEKKLQELSERLELAIQSAQIGIWEFDFASNRLIWDERMLAIHGVSPETFHGTYEDWSSRVHPDDLLQAQPDISEEQAIYNTEFRIIRPDGTVRWVMSYSCKQRNYQGELVRAVGVNIDISDRKNTELVLKDLSDRLEFALKGANIGIWEYQINEGRLIWDERMFTLYGVSSEEFLGKYEDWLQRVHPDDLDMVQQAQQKAHQGDKECRAEFRIICPDGTIRFIDSYAFNQYNAQGEIQKTIGLNIDITDRKQAELELQRINEELIRATRLKDEFLANMSHELRTPLNAILGMTEILEEQIFGDLNDRQMQSLHTIENSSKHLLELINDILDVAKIEAGQIHLSCQPSNIEALCQSSLVFIKQQAFNKKIQLESLIPPNLPTINLDERRIRQVLINLLNNAVKFTSNGGKISLQVSYIQVLDNVAIAQGCPCDTIEMSVIDTGIGIAPDQIKRLFQPFVQVESALNRSYNGTGLGLALVKRLVELHGGEVRLTSELGVGSCFTIALPITPFCESSIVPESPLPSTTESILKIEDVPLILLAEDNEENINLFADYLSLKGYRLVIAHNGRMAIDLAQQIHPDLILMDIQMPEMDGLEAIQRIRQIPELANTPIIALTALAMSGDRDRCIAVGANDYLSKPVSLKQLVQKINTYLTESYLKNVT